MGEDTRVGAGGKGAGMGTGVGAGGAAKGPGLLATTSPCRNFFPSGAVADHGAVRIDVEVDVQGRARPRRLVHESPLGQGFGSAARACAAALRFAPAVDARGVAVAGEAKLELRFDRSRSS